MNNFSVCLNKHGYLKEGESFLYNVLYPIQSKNPDSLKTFIKVLNQVKELDSPFAVDDRIVFFWYCRIIESALSLSKECSSDSKKPCKFNNGLPCPIFETIPFTDHNAASYGHTAVTTRCLKYLQLNCVKLNIDPLEFSDFLMTFLEALSILSELRSLSSKR